MKDLKEQKLTIEVTSQVGKYESVPVQFYDDTNLSLEAWGILGKIFFIIQTKKSLTLSVDEVLQSLNAEQSIVNSAIEELQKYGYLYITKSKWMVFTDPKENPFHCDTDDQMKGGNEDE